MDHSALMLANFEALPEMLGAEDVEALLQIDRKTIYTYADRGLIPQKDPQRARSHMGSRLE